MGFLKSINSLFMCLLASAQLQQLTLLSSFRLSTEPVGTKENGSEIMVEQMADQTESLPRDSQSTPVINMTKLQLSTYLVDNAPTTEARFLLDFVIAGFPQCGTTTLGTWLGNHPEIQVQPGENHQHGFPVDQMVRSLFRNLKEHHKDPFQVKKGFSSPHYIQSER